jgi:hypothetical protein
MEFRLVYQGPLPSSPTKPRTAMQHAIRKKLHVQSFQYWREHPHLKQILNENGRETTLSTGFRPGRDFMRGPHSLKSRATPPNQTSAAVPGSGMGVDCCNKLHDPGSLMFKATGALLLV